MKVYGRYFGYMKVYEVYGSIYEGIFSVLLSPSSPLSLPLIRSPLLPRLLPLALCQILVVGNGLGLEI